MYHAEVAETDFVFGERLETDSANESKIAECEHNFVHVLDILKQDLEFLY